MSPPHTAAAPGFYRASGLVHRPRADSQLARERTSQLAKAAIRIFRESQHANRNRQIARSLPSDVTAYPFFNSANRVAKPADHLSNAFFAYSHWVKEST